MKHLFLAIFLMTATCSLTLPAGVVAQTSTTVTLSAFTSKVNLLDTYIAAGNMTAANSTWAEVHNMMLNVLAKSKTSIRSATTTTDKDAHIATLKDQETKYWEAWNLKTNLSANRAAIHTKLGEFGSTIY